MHPSLSRASCKKVGLGQFNYGDASFSVLIQTVGQGMDLMGLGLHMQVSPLAVFSLKKNNIREPKDRQGSRRHADDRGLPPVPGIRESDRDRQIKDQIPLP
jgi:hypothetical protein